ncbi:MAG: hypothetical protein U0795_26455 [Pirellulales bacterium]
MSVQRGIGPPGSSDVDRLVESQVLRELPDTYPKSYDAPEVYAFSYEEIEG